MDEVQSRCDRACELLGAEYDALIVVPPFADIYRPSLGVHLLQAAAEQAGLRVRVLYANLLFAAIAGEDTYYAISNGSYEWLWGERIFARAAFDLPPLGSQVEELRQQIANPRGSRKQNATFEQLAALEQEAIPFCSALGERLKAFNFRMAGASTTFHQTAAAIALLAQVKRANPAVITAIGGANCEGEMAQGIASLLAPIDYIFSGECESVFPDFLRRAVDGQSLPSGPIVYGEPCFDLDSLPEPSFDEYFSQLENALPGSSEKKQIWLPFESSRGCWWGARQHCTFCGLNGQTMAFRQKSPDRMIDGVKRLLARYPSQYVAMMDNILPHSYFRTVLPRLAEEPPTARIYYEVKSNLTLHQVELLRRAGIERAQPGIEALSSSLLRRMKKGVLARQNLALLRYARAAGLFVNWNLLCQFPGDDREDYEQTLAVVRLLHHLHPPSGVAPVSIDRFSPYFKDAPAYGINDLQPLPAYAWAFPPHSDLRSLAYHFKGQYACAQASHPEIYDLLETAVRDWHDSWKVGAPPPTLSLTAGDDGYYTLMDTRGLEGTDMLQFLNEDEARTLLIGGPLDRQPLAEWAIEHKLAVALDDWCAPLAVTDVETWRHLEGQAPQAIRQTTPAAV